MRVGVYGSASGGHPEDVLARAKLVGTLLARNGHTVVTCGCWGLPYEAVLGAVEEGGAVEAFSPAVDLNQHKNLYRMPTEGFTKFVFIPKDYEHIDNARVCLKYRNVASVATVDAGIFISGHSGTLNELTIVLDTGKTAGVLLDTGGISGGVAQKLFELLGLQEPNQVHLDSDPLALLKKMCL